jgi:hypothetical protein
LIVIIRSLFAGVATIPDIAANFNLSAAINGELVDEPLNILRERAFCSREKNPRESFKRGSACIQAHD